MTSTNSPLNVAIPTLTELTHNAAVLLQQSLAQAVQASNPSTATPYDLQLARSNTEAQAFVLANGLYGAYRYLRDFIARQAVPIYSSGEFLDGWLATYGLPRKAASAATGSISGTGVAGSAVPAGTQYQSSAGQTVRIITGVTIPAGGAYTAQVVAVSAGAASNQLGGAALTLVSSVAGVDSGATVGTAGLGGGADVETDDEALYRLTQRLGNEPMGGAPADYARWALATAGITRAWGIRNPAGPCTAGVVIMADNNPLGLPSTAQQQAVYDYIKDPLRGPPDDLFVIVPTAQVINITLQVTPDSPEIRAAIVAELKNLFVREASPGGSIPHTHLTEAVSVANGEYTHTFTSPVITSGGVLAAPNWQTVLALGVVTFV
jgi:uncharacterized phage protein gp47/JayE